jgi:hypothetical protein
MRVTQEKIQHYVGIKYGKDIANKICNKVTAVLWPPQYSDAIVNRHQEWERHSRRKQTNLLAPLKDQLQGLKANQNADPVKVATPSNDLEHGGQDDLILSAKLIRIAPETSSF